MIDEDLGAAIAIFTPATGRMGAASQRQLSPINFVPYPPGGGKSGIRELAPPPAFTSPASVQSVPISVPPPAPSPSYLRVSVDCGVYPGTTGTSINGGYACLPRSIDQTPTSIPYRTGTNCTEYPGARAFRIPGGVICLQR
jgi:hypothetical protein